MNAKQSIAFRFKDGSWKGYDRAHLLAMHLWWTKTGEERLHLFFSTESILIEGSALDWLKAKIESGDPTEKENIPSGYNITGIRPLKYKDWHEDNPAPTIRTAA